MKNDANLIAAPYIPPDVQKHMDENGYELKCAQGFYWYVAGVEDGESFELGAELFIALCRASEQWVAQDII